MTHVGAAIPNLAYAADTHYPWQVDEVIEGGKLAIVDGCVDVPTGPGLGVTLDHAELARLHQQYLDCGIRKRDDATEMRKWYPGFERMGPNNQTGIPRPEEGLAPDAPSGPRSAGVGKWDGLMRDVLYPKL